jgi:hypothetical protein
LSQGIKERLAQGATEPIIAAILGCKSVVEVIQVIVPALLNDPTTVRTISRYLKQIAVITIKLSDFRPESNPVEKEQIGSIIREFQKFLEQHIRAAGERESLPAEDILTMIKIE